MCVVDLIFERCLTLASKSFSNFKTYLNTGKSGQIMAEDENNKRLMLLTAYTLAVEWFEGFEKILSTKTLAKQEILQHLDNANMYIDTLIDRMIGLIDQSDNNYSTAIFQIQTIIQNLKLKLEKNPERQVTQDQTSLKSKFHKVIDECKIKTKAVSFCDIAGYEGIKQQLKAIMILPRRQPQLFTSGKLPKTVLLYGPPGTGKTQLAHALAAEANADIFCVTASSIVSSYVGETEKMVDALFKTMRSAEKVSILFLDEIDGLCRKRNGTEHDHNRRLKTEIMCHLSNFEDNSNAFLVCATNCPWDLDSAFLRRFQKRIYVPLPNRQDRMSLLKLYTQDTTLAKTSTNWEKLIDLTEGYSGSDLKQLVNSALQKPIYELTEVKIWKLDGSFYVPAIGKGSQEFSENLRFCSLDELPERTVKCREVTLDDLEEAVKSVRKTIPESETKRFNEYIIEN